MKTLYIVRHGKSVPAGTNIPDADRMLTDTGVTRTIKIAAYIAELKPAIDRILASPAERAYDTALILADKLGLPASIIETREKLFTGDDSDALDMIADLDDSLQTVMVVGHNPYITRLANRFANPVLESLPTTGVVSVHVNTPSWSEVSKAPVSQNFTVWPGML
jgi:phosphohistidine phosphatase